MRTRHLHHVAIVGLFLAASLAFLPAPASGDGGDTIPPDCLTPTQTVAPQTVVGVCNGAALEEVRLSKALRNGPPVVARALALAHTCMYDAWAAYDTKAVGTVLGASLRRPNAEHMKANKAKAISFAAHRCLTNLYP